MYDVLIYKLFLYYRIINLMIYICIFYFIHLYMLFIKIFDE